MSFMRNFYLLFAVFTALTMGCLEPVSVNPVLDCNPGETFKSSDGCNDCVCPDSGLQAEASCTEMACDYDACLGKSCGDPCSICEPADPKCVEPAIISACNPQGECVALDNGQTEKDLCEGPCAAMDAGGEGPCEAELGFRWTGTSCVSFSGCSCIGADCDKLYQSAEECQEAHSECIETYEPCDGKVCGEPCSVCDPSDALCVAPAVETACNSQGACVAVTPDLCETDLCADVSCPAIPATCFGNAVIAGSDPGSCDPMTGECVYKKTNLAINCTLDGMICKDGECVEPSGDLCGFNGLMCEPDSICDIHGCGEDAVGVCTPMIDGCDDNYDPVCGCDGKTYSNDCYRLQFYGVALKHVGACEDTTTCAPMKAAGKGPCEVEIGVAWNGKQCTTISGCECEGPDCDKIYPSIEICENAQSQCNACEPTQATGVGPCPAFWGWAWNGDSCYPLSGCDCEGPDCNNENKLFETPEACEKAYSECKAYDPCAGKVCGDPCAMCDPNDPDCKELPLELVCNEWGKCDVPYEATCPVEEICEPSNAKGDGFCDAVLGWTWDGTNCTPISGCECQGSDCWNIFKFHATQEACIESHKACGAFDACEGKSCGEACNPCPPGVDCPQIADMNACNEDGACVAVWGGMCGPENTIDATICMGGVMLPSDPFEITDVSIKGDALIAVVSYSGGCEEHDFSACAYSMPPPPGAPKEAMAFAMTISHEANGDICEAWVTEEVVINLKPIKDEWVAKTGLQTGTIPIAVEGTDMVFFYEF